MSTQENNSVSPQLDYTVVEKPPYIVISFRGRISQVTKSVIEKCQEEVLSKSFQYVLLNFKDVTKIENNGIIVLSCFRKAVRDKQSTIRICSLKKEMRAVLLETGTFGLSEISENLATAIRLL